MNDYTEREAHLIELIHFLAYGTESEQGMSLEEVMNFLESRVRSRENARIFDLLCEDGRALIDELKSHVEERS